jgi:UDP-GlcNAc:undecaprenyl-phosphate/decaprenyl-phosphate GlcNAc-1-phosphate transferase
MISIFSLGLACVYAALVALIIGTNADRLALLLTLYDRPGGRKLHKRPTPLMGGLVLVVALVPIIIAYMLSYEPEGIGHWALASFAVTMIGSALVGIFDDRKPFSARRRFAITLALFSLLLIIEPRFALQSLQFTGIESAISLGRIGGSIFTLFILLGFLNAVNMADGKNGLVIGLSIIWSGLLAYTGPGGLIPVLLPFATLLVILLLYNIAGRLFLGDGGTYGLAALISLAATYSYYFHGGTQTADALILMFLIPVADMMRLIVVRIAAGRSPLDGDRDHFHHHLLSWLGWPGGLIIYWLLVAVPNLWALKAPEQVPLLIAASLAIYFAIVAIAHARLGRETNISGEAPAE